MSKHHHQPPLNLRLIYAPILTLHMTNFHECISHTPLKFEPQEPPSSPSVYKNRKEYLKITNTRKMTKKSCLRFWLVFGGFRSTVHTSHARPIAILLQPTKAFYCFKTFQNFIKIPNL